MSLLCITESLNTVYEVEYQNFRGCSFPCRNLGLSQAPPCPSRENWGKSEILLGSDLAVGLSDSEDPLGHRLSPGTSALVATQLPSVNCALPRGPSKNFPGMQAPMSVAVGGRNSSRNRG